MAVPTGASDASLTAAASAVPYSPQKPSPGSFEAPHCWHLAASGAPQSAQNLRPSRLSRPHFEQRILRSQFLEQSLCVFQVGGIEAFGEPVVDGGEHRARLVATALLVEQPRETHRCAQLP